MTNTITSGQRKQIVRCMEDKLVAMNLDKEDAQRLIEHGNELQEGLRTLIQQLSMSNQFADEEVESTYVYANGYMGPKSMTEQTNLLRVHFPGVGYANEDLAKQPLQDRMEGHFAIPDWTTFAPTYGDALERVIAKLKETRTVHNYREDQLGPEFLKQHPRTVKMFQTLREQQKGNSILVVQAQFGLRHRGRSVRRAREVLKANEFGLDAFSVAIMLLTHPERLVAYENLWIDCAGDEYQAPEDGRPRAPFWYFDDGGLGFGTFWFGRAFPFCGSASAVLPSGGRPE